MCFSPIFPRQNMFFFFSALFRAKKGRFPSTPQDLVLGHVDAPRNGHVFVVLKVPRCWGIGSYTRTTRTSIMEDYHAAYEWEAVSCPMLPYWKSTVAMDNPHENWRLLMDVNGSIISKWWIFHCHVWVLEGTPSWKQTKTRWKALAPGKWSKNGGSISDLTGWRVNDEMKRTMWEQNRWWYRHEWKNIWTKWSYGSSMDK